MTADEAALEQELSDPTPETVAALRALDGDLVVLGAGGKMGPSLARLAARSRRIAGGSGRVLAVARFTDPALRPGLQADGVETLVADLLDQEQVARLPGAAAVIFMAGQKFGTSIDAPLTWATNTLAPAFAARRYRGVPLVAFSTGNVYPLWPASSLGPAESDDPGPVGEYAQSALARERVLEFRSRADGTPMTLLRLNYAVEPRYGVVRDIADRVASGAPVDLRMGWVNLIWQRDANAAALRTIAHAAVPPLVLNLTGPKASVRLVAEALGRRLGRSPVFAGTEAGTALLSDPGRCRALLGDPPVGLDDILDRVAAWIRSGGRALGKPTRFEERSGRF